jgi:ankyrin repeat protein
MQKVRQLSTPRSIVPYDYLLKASQAMFDPSTVENLFLNSPSATSFGDYIDNAGAVSHISAPEQIWNSAPTISEIRNTPCTYDFNTILTPSHMRPSANAGPSGLTRISRSTWRSVDNGAQKATWGRLNLRRPSQFREVGFGAEPRGVAGLSPRGVGFFDDFETLEFTISSKNLLKSMQPLLQPVLRSIRVFVDDRHGLVSYGRYHPKSLQMLQIQDTDFAIVYFILDRLINDPYPNRALFYPIEPLNKLFKAALEYVLFHGTQHLSILFETVSGHFSRSLEQSLFCAAVQLNAAEAVAALLSRNMSLNVPYRFHVYDMSLPLEEACENHHLDVAATLLLHGADPNECDAFGLLYKNTHPGSPPSPISSDFIRTLVEFGAKIQAHNAGDIFRHCQLDILQFLADNAIVNTFNIFIQGGALSQILLRTDWEHEFLPMISTLLQGRDHSRQNHRVKMPEKALTIFLKCAALRGRTKVIELLVAAGAKADTECLICAAYSKDTDVFLFFLDLGLDPNECHCDRPSPRRSEVLTANIRSPGYEETVEDSPSINNDRATALSTCIMERFQGAIVILLQRGHLAQATNQEDSYMQALCGACIVGDIEMIRLLLDYADPWCLESKGSKAMNQAIKSSQNAAVHELLRLGIKPDGSSLLAAVQGGHSEILTLLRTGVMAAPCNELLYDKILIGAILRGYYDFAKGMVKDRGSAIGVVLLNADDHRLVKSSLDLPSLDGFERVFSTTLSCAILMGNTEIVALLSTSGAQTPLSSFRSALAFESRFHLNEGSHFYEVSFLMTPLAACALTSNLTLFRELLNLGVDACDDFAIYGATVSGHQQLLEVLLDSCRLICSDLLVLLGIRAVLWSVRNHSMQILKTLADFVKPNELMMRTVTYDHQDALTSSDSPFLEAVRLHCEQGDDDQALRILLPYIKDVNFIACGDGVWADTPLIYAIRLNSLRTVRVLVEEGNASPSLPCRWGCRRTPLQAAAEVGCMEIVEYLLEKGAQPNEVPATHAGGTALQLAAIKGLLGVAAKLLAVNADVNAAPSKFDGRTAFEGATEHGRVDMMLFLFKNGADLLSDDRRQYRRAVEFAKENTQYAAVDLAKKLLKEALKKEEEDRIFFDSMLDLEMGDVGGYPNRG